MPKKKAKLWEAPPHTVAKLRILRAYLDSWLPIIGISFKNRDLVYIDGFAGPGEYTNYSEGSPVVAVQAAEQALQSLKGAWGAGSVYMYFFEPEPWILGNLRKKLEDVHISNAKLKPHEPLGMSFVDGLRFVQALHPHHFSSRLPLLAFVDPFGVSGVPFGAIASILESHSSEVLINFDADGVNRVLNSTNPGKDQMLDELFGTPEWRHRLASLDSVAVCREALRLYEERLKTLFVKPYVYSFEMRSTRITPDYFLVFASGSHLGLRKMKEAMATVDQSGDFKFVDTHVGQLPLFRASSVEEHALDMWSHYNRQSLSYDEVDYYALLDTPFNNPKQMLRVIGATRSNQSRCDRPPESRHIQ